MGRGSGGSGSNINSLKPRTQRSINTIKRVGIESATKTPTTTFIRTPGGTVYKVPNKLTNKYLKKELSGIDVKYGNDFQNSGSLKL